jgi:ATP-binding cassette subfamily F protein uup
MSLLRLEKISLAYGHRPLLADVDLEIERGERLCLLGRNGEGKSSLIRVIAGVADPDDGELRISPETRISLVAQDADLENDTTVYEYVATGVADQGELLRNYHQELAGSKVDEVKLGKLQDELEAAGAWAYEQKIETVVSRLNLDGGASCRSLSGGWRRRAMLARALVSDPDLLLLDEPTNHLDLDSIAWLENTMTEFDGALLFVSHDRAFIRRLATRIVELDRGQLTSWPGDYDNYLRRRAERVETEQRHNALFDKKLSEEEAWIRKGIKARRTRNEGRVRQLEALREQRKQRIERPGLAKLALEKAEKSGKVVFEAEDLCFAYGDQPIVDRLNMRVMRGDRLGLIGANGTGKSTLIALLLGEIAPDAGTVRRGSRLAVAYFDQQRAQLDPGASVMDSVADGNQTITTGGRKLHVASYLQRFLFPSERLQSPVRSLSGGERNRLLLARLFARPANLLVLDEPTNDLDVETLELLEELISEFDGTVLLVSHDRAFLDNVVTSSLVFAGGGRIAEHVGGYTDWQRFSKRAAREQRLATPPVDRSAKKPKRAATSAKLSYKDQRELEALPVEIETLEAEQAQLHETVNAAGFYEKSAEETGKVLERLAEIERILSGRYERWEALESLSKKMQQGQ